MHPDKSPGLDGLNPGFYQAYWDIIGWEVTNMCNQFLDSSTLQHPLNITNLVLIPKISNPQKMSDLRPIALCNVLYKILTKILATRLKSILSSIISDNQSAFVKGRSITDNIIVAFETQHYINGKRQGNNGVLALKADMSKAFDRVEWGFLRGIMSKLGFCSKWVMMCVSSVSMNILYNGSPVQSFIPQRGLRQGDPISPYLFIMITEGLSALLRNAESRGILHGVAFTKRAPKVTHLLFADDSYFFFNAKVSEVQAFMNIIHLYSVASGQIMNADKSTVYFSPNVNTTLKSSLQNILGVNVGSMGSYLGLPSMGGKNKCELLGYIKNRMINKIKGWGHRFLSRAGREVFLKSVLQALPTYTMSVFLLPKTLTKEVEIVMNSFWWKGDCGTSKGIHWQSWERLCLPKQWGGMGFRNMRDFNLALLSKQAWHLIHHPSSLAAKVLKAKYYPDTSFIDARKTSNPSFIWSSLYETRDIIRKSTRWRVGNGESIKIWEDNWLPNNLNPKITTPQYPFLLNATLDYLIQTNDKDWDRGIISDIFNSRDARLILSIPIARKMHADRQIWAHDPDGRFTVKSTYKFLANSPLTLRKFLGPRSGITISLLRSRASFGKPVQVVSLLQSTSFPNMLTAFLIVNCVLMILKTLSIFLLLVLLLWISGIGLIFLSLLIHLTPLLTGLPSS